MGQRAPFPEAGGRDRAEAASGLVKVGLSRAASQVGEWGGQRPTTETPAPSGGELMVPASQEYLLGAQHWLRCPGVHGHPVRSVRGLTSLYRQDKAAQGPEGTCQICARMEQGQPQSRDPEPKGPDTLRCARVHTCGYIHECLCTCVGARTGVHAWECVCTHVNACIYMHVCVNARLCACACGENETGRRVA